MILLEEELGEEMCFSTDQTPVVVRVYSDECENTKIPGIRGMYQHKAVHVKRDRRLEKSIQRAIQRAQARAKH